ncbi:unnamed protein product [Effrenium voratum]|nr:unnamed protein product [Effrenium voratum]
MRSTRSERQISGTARMRREDLNAVKPLRPLGAPPGSGGPAARRRLEQSPVTAFLRELNLGQYAEVMRDHGFDDLETLICIEEPHMREMGMPAGHIVKLKRSLKECGEVTVPRTLQSKAFQPCNTTMTAVQLSWQQVKALGTDVVGGLFYKKFFQIEPKAKALFPISVRLRYKDWDTHEEETEDPEESPALRKLWAKFITVVGSAVAGMQDTEKLGAGAGGKEAGAHVAAAGRAARGLRLEGPLLQHRFQGAHRSAGGVAGR